MLRDKKLNLERFKKSSHGLIEFATLIEQADANQRDRIIEQAKAQDEEFVFNVMKRVVYFEELAYLDEAILAELLSKVSPKVLAFALAEMPEDFKQKMLRNLGIRDRRTYEDESERLTEGFHKGFMIGAQKAVLKAARRLEAENKFVFEVLNSPRLKRKKSR